MALEGGSGVIKLYSFWKMNECCFWNLLEEHLRMQGCYQLCQVLTKTLFYDDCTLPCVSSF